MGEPVCKHGLPGHLEDHPTVPGAFRLVCDHAANPTAWDPDVEQAMVAIADALGATVAPLADALQQARQGAAVTLDRFVQCYAALAAVVALLDRGAVRGNWAGDQAILDTARDLVARLSPIPPTTGEPDAHTP